jgi:ABC-type lipoprotein release transport system permease subunit
MNICLGTIFGHYIQFEMQPLTLAVWLGAAIVAVMLAALLPARRAAHVNILEAVRYE